MSNIIPITTDSDNVSVDLGQIQFDRSITPGAVPLAANVKVGAIAINLADKKIFTKDHNGTVVSLGKDYASDIAAAQTNATTASNTYTDGAISTLKGGTLDAALDTVLKLGNRLKTAEADIIAGANSVTSLTKADVGLGNVENFGISDAIDEANSSQYASSAAVKIAYDRAVTAETNAAAYTDQVKSDLLGGAPAAALDTLVELGDALTANGDAIVAINAAIALRAETTYVDAQLALKIDKASISDSIISDSTTNVASSKAVKDAVTAAQAATDAMGATKVNVSDLSSLTDSVLETKAATSKAVNDARVEAINHANSLVIGLAANMDYGQTF